MSSSETYVDAYFQYDKHWQSKLASITALMHAGCCKGNVLYKFSRAMAFGDLSIMSTRITAYYKHFEHSHSRYAFKLSFHATEKLDLMKGYIVVFKYNKRMPSMFLLNRRK